MKAGIIGCGNISNIYFNCYKIFNNFQVIKAEELLTLNVDILIPAALDNQINKDNVEQIKAKVILELANGPIIFDADNGGRIEHLPYLIKKSLL